MKSKGKSENNKTGAGQKKNAVKGSKVSATRRNSKTQDSSDEYIESEDDDQLTGEIEDLNLEDNFDDEEDF